MEENKLNGREDYYNVKGYISASLLKELSSSPRNAKGMLLGEQKQTKALDFGSLVDCLLTTPERFQSDYVIYEGNAPTDKMLLLARDYIRKYITLSEMTEEPNEDLIALSSRAEVGYDARLKNDTFLTKFAEEALPYCNFCITNKDKIIIDRETYNHANQINLDTRGSKFLTKIFNPETNTTVLFQVPIYVHTTRFEGKALIDCVIINHTDKTVTPIDFKTYEDNFTSNYWKYKYYYQEAWYKFLLETLRHPHWFVDCEIPSELAVLHDEGYTVTDFEFVAIDKSLKRNIIVYKTYSDLYKDLFYDGNIVKNAFDIIKVKSIESLIEEMFFRVKNDNWEDDYDMLNNGYKNIWL